MTVKSLQLKRFFHNKNILVTGGTGSIGKHIVAALVDYHPKKLVIYNKDDSKQYSMQQQYAGNKNIHFYLGDIRDYDSIEYATRGIDYVFHTAALKQVPVCEEHPYEAVKTNVIGSENLIRASIDSGVKKVVNISTDKAINPTNTMGATKLIAEKLFKNANSMLNNKHTRFCSVRFGNVIGSRGSVVPLLMEQAKFNQPLTLTDPSMTRFFMTIPQTINLMLKAAYYFQGGETFILKMKSLRIKDLAETVQAFYTDRGLKAPAIKRTGARPGEKQYEELMHATEMEDVFEDEEMYVILSPAVSSASAFLHFQPTTVTAYRSDQVQTIAKQEIYELLTKMEAE